MLRIRWVLAALGLIAAVAAALPMASAAQTTNERCFRETGQCITGRFLEYWQQNGDLAVFGYPVGPARIETNSSGDRVLTQWFERNRFELHPGKARPYDVLLGRLGDDRLQQMGARWQDQAHDSGPREGCLWFAETRLNVCDQAANAGMKTYWLSNGLADPRLDEYGRSLALFGLPITQPRMELNSSGDRVLTQWFERARFEWHPDKPQRFQVLLGLLGNEISTRVGLHPTISYIDGNTLYERNVDGAAVLIATLPDMGRVLDAVEISTGIVLLREQGLQRVAAGGTVTEIARFQRGNALFGGLIQRGQSDEVIYSYARQSDQPVSFTTVVGIVSGGTSARRVLTHEGNLLTLGFTPDRQGIYVVPVGQDPSFGTMWVISVEDGRTLREIPVSGYGAGGISADGRTFLAWEQAADGTFVVELADLVERGTPVRQVALPRGWMPNGALWGADARAAYVYLLRMGGGPDSNGELWSIDREKGQLTKVAEGIPADAFPWAATSDSRWLMMREARGILVVDLGSGRTALRAIPQAATVVRWR